MSFESAKTNTILFLNGTSIAKGVNILSATYF